MSRSYRILAVALVGVLVLVGLAKIVDGGPSSKGGTSSAAGTDEELATNTDSEAANDSGCLGVARSHISGSRNLLRERNSDVDRREMRLAEN